MPRNLNVFVQLKALRRTNPKRFALAMGMVAGFVVLWAGILGWGFGPVHLVPQLPEWRFVLPTEHHQPVRMPFRDRGGLPTPSLDGAFQMTSVDFDRG